MYGNNPNMLEKSVWSRADEVQREVQKANRFPVNTRAKSKVLVIAGLLMALGWVFSLIL